jgi:hypothetical protein
MSACTGVPLVLAKSTLRRDARCLNDAIAVAAKLIDGLTEKSQRNKGT